MGDKIMKKDQQIGCTVYDCQHCNCDDECCKLEEIKVCNCDHTKEKEATMCDSYQKKSN